ncbi:MAG: hypothetical protein ACK4V9_13255 [Aphanizomenon sp.]
MFRRVLCSLSLAASIVIVSSASSYGVTPNGRQIAEAAKIAQKIIQKKKPQDAWKTSGQLIKTSGENVRNFGMGIGSYCFGTKQAPPCPRSDSSDNKTNSQPKRVFENATHNFQKPNPLLQGNGVFQASPLVGERFGDLKMKPTHNLQKPNPLLQGNGF